MKLRVGLVGLGDSWEARHRPALRSLADRFEVRAVCEEIAQRAHSAARDFSADAIDGFRAMANRPDVDALLMLAPQWYGYLPILAACEAGKAVYCTSAIEWEPDQARRMRQRVDEAGVAFMAEFPRRHAPATLRLKELIATQLGQPQLLFCHQRLKVEEINNNHLQGRPIRRGATSTRHLVELVDWCRYVVGNEPSSVVGVRHRTADQKDEDYQMMSLDFSPPGTTGQGAMAQISCGHYMPASWHEAISFRPPAALQVCCEHGIAFIDLPATLIWFDSAGRHMESLESERPVGEHLLLQFYRAVTSLVRNTSGLEDAYRAVSVVMSAYQSFAEGKRVTLEF